MKRPRLCPATFADDELLARAIDAMTIKTKAYARARRKVIRAQLELRRLVDDRAWRQYLKVEEAANERDADQVYLLVRWALRAGVRWGRRHRA